MSKKRGGSTMTGLKRLEDEFDADMRRILNREGEAKLNSTRFRQMIEQYGAVEAAHRLLKPDRQSPPGTFGYLRDIGRLALTMEFCVVMDKYNALFSQNEREIARFRLDKED
jgi:hypothetical protein